MPYYIVHTGTALKKLSTSGVFSALTLPTGVTVVSTRPARFAALGEYLLIGNATSVNVKMRFDDLSFTKLNPAAPATACTAAAGAAGNLTGDYRYKISYVIKDTGVITSESGLGPESAVVTLAAQKGSLTSIPVSADADVTGRRIYRTTKGGVEYYLAGEIANNTATTYTDDLSDYDLALLPAETDLGSPPGVDATDWLRLLTVWKDRAFGVGAEVATRDFVRWSGNRKVWAWNEDNVIPARPVGEDEYGVTAFMARRDELGVAKRRRLWKIIGDTPSEYRMIQVAEGVGSVSQDASIIVRDVAYFLSEDGFYEWGTSGIKNLSRDQVHPWFNTDDYFNRAEFDRAFAKWNPFYDVIELHLPAAGSTDIDRWVTYDLRRNLWLGPHRTACCTPTCGALVDDANALRIPVVGASNGFVYKENQAAFTDDTSAIDFQIETKFHSMNTPDIQKYFGELAVISKIESAGTCTITPKVGGLNATAGATISHALTTGRERMRRLGTGRYVELKFANAENNQGCELYGYEIPYHELGRR